MVSNGTEMHDPDEELFQFRMTKDECQLFNLLRRLEEEPVGLLAAAKDPRL
jgi:hypothetical protein